MRAKIIGCALAVLLSFAGIAQKKIQFASINTAGIASGESGAYGVLQTVNGIKYQQWFFGIGGGIDYYKNKTMPLFADVRMAFPKTKLFVFGDLGYNIPLQEKPGKEVYYYDTYNLFGGSYSELGIGYTMRLFKQNYVLFTSGYSYKKLNATVGLVNPCLVGPCPLNYTSYEYGYGRILFKAGISF